MSANPKVQDRYEGVIYDPAEAVRELEKETAWTALDLETGGLSPWKDPIAVISLYGQNTKKSAVLHVKGIVPDFLLAYLSDPKREFVTHNGASFDILFLANYGVDYRSPKFFDTLVAEAVTLVTNRRDVRVNLQDTLKRRLGVHINKGMGTSPWMSPELTEQQLSYCIEDVMLLPGLREKQIEICSQDCRKDALDFEQRLVPVVVEMVMNGLPFNEDALHQYQLELELASQAASDRLVDLFGPINYNSPKQVKDAFNNTFSEELGEEGLTSTNRENLTALVEMKPDRDVHVGSIGQAAEDMLQVRMAVKRKGMYSDEWIGKYVHKDRHGITKVHSRFWQVGTDTGRFSSSEPNLQQVPRNGRRIFRAPEGYSYFKVDYSQLEVKVAAVLSDDHQLIEDMKTGDVHRQLASSIYRITPEEVTSDQRKSAKAATFTCIFFGSPRALVRYARLLGQKMTEEEAQDIHFGFFRRYRGLALARQKAYYRAQSPAVVIQLPTGLKRQLAGDNLTPQRIMNTTVQGTAAAGLKKALMLCKEKGVMPYVGAVVHDEIVGCAPTAIVDSICLQVADSMVEGMRDILGWEPTDPWDIEVEGAIGPTWEGYKGVEWTGDKTHPWMAVLKGEGATHKMGPYSTAQEAARSYDEMALSLQGPDAKTNF